MPYPPTVPCWATDDTASTRIDPTEARQLQVNAHLALPMIGGGHVRVDGRVLSANEGLRGAGLEPIMLEAKEARWVPSWAWWLRSWSRAHSTVCCEPCDSGTSKVRITGATMGDAMQWDHLSERLNELLGLEFAPVAISFHDQAPSNGAPWFEAPMSEPTEDGRSGKVAAPCVFWMHAHEGTFHTAPADHGNCSVGRFTHGLAGPEDIMDKSDVAALLDVGWVTMEAFSGVAALSRRPEAITYGPLAEASTEPDVVMLRLHPRQMMELGDAVPVEFSGKPQCQILPRAADSGTIAASMGCALSRARTGMGDDELTVAIPGSRVEEVVAALEPVTRADEAVVGYATADMARFA